MFTVVYNPASGNGRGEKLLPKVIEELERRKIDYSVVRTVRHADKDYYKDVPCSCEDTVCVVGGDGTVNGVLSRLSQRHMRLIVVPCGTGNDFIKCVKLPKDPIEALRRQLDGEIRPLDYASLGGECFLNVFGIGFDVEVLKKLDRFKEKYSGLKAYLRALVSTIREYRPTECEISVDGRSFEHKSVSILSVGNGQFIGGGMKAVPSANPFDGLLNVVEVKPIKRRHLLLLLPTFVLGLHVKLGLGKTYTCKRLVIKGSNLGFQIDGEIRSADTIEISVVQGELSFGV